MGDSGHHTCLPSGNRISAVHVRHDSDRRVFLKAGDAGGLAGLIHDGIDPAQPPADHIQRGIRAESTCGPHHLVFSVRNRRGTASEQVL